MGIFKGEKVGLVGPNGSGKSTIFRLIVNEEQPDSGQVVVERGVTIGYFSQDVGEMSGRSVLEETMAGAGEVSEAAHELHALEHAMADPAQADDLESIIEPQIAWSKLQRVAEGNFRVLGPASTTRQKDAQVAPE